jgi:hypothetical protein
MPLLIGNLPYPSRACIVPTSGQDRLQAVHAISAVLHLGAILPLGSAKKTTVLAWSLLVIMLLSLSARGLPKS